MSNIRMSKEQKNERKLNDVIRFMNIMKTGVYHLFMQTENKKGRVWDTMDEYYEYIASNYIGPNQYKPKDGPTRRFSARADSIIRNWRAGKAEGVEERYTDEFVTEFMMKWVQHYVAVMPSVERMKGIREGIKGVFLNQDLLKTHGRFYLTWNTYQDPYDHANIVLRKSAGKSKSSLWFPTLPDNLISKLESWCILNLDDRINASVRRSKENANIRSIGYSVNNVIRNMDWIQGYQTQIANIAPTYEKVEAVGDALIEWLDTMPSIEGAGEYNGIIRVDNLKQVIEDSRPSSKLESLNKSIKICEQSIDGAKKSIEQCLDWLGMTIEQWHATAKDRRNLLTTTDLNKIKTVLGYGGEEE
tara:strand:- start:2004 stop:3080 length:1077 start_codon:yes stop_codon:yes gene_type:complete